MAAANLLLSSLNLPSKLEILRETPSLQNHVQCSRLKTKRRHRPVVCSVLHKSATIADVAIGYSTASYYTSLGLFVISVPGFWSFIKRKEGKKNGPNQVVGQTLSFFTRNNFVVLDKGETITFEGMMVPSRGQAALLTFYTCISLANIALVLTITLPDVGNYWFALTLPNPLAGVYYWKRASRKEQIKVKMIPAEDGKLSEIIVQGDDQQVDQLRRELQLTEKGMVYVKGIFER